MNIIVRQINPHHVIIQVVNHSVLILRTRRFLFCSLISLGLDFPVRLDQPTRYYRYEEQATCCLQNTNFCKLSRLVAWGRHYQSLYWSVETYLWRIKDQPATKYQHAPPQERKEYSYLTYNPVPVSCHTSVDGHK